MVFILPVFYNNIFSIMHETRLDSIKLQEK